MDSLKGKLLVAVPQLPDENFYRTVVLILRHDEHGALGLILNRPTPITLSKIWQKISGGNSDLQEPVYFGGPVQGPLMAIHCHFSVAEDDILPGVFYSARREQLDALVDEKKLPFKIFTGHSGWGSGQLENELKAGGWLVVESTYEHVFDEPDSLWKRVCEDFGNNILVAEKFRSKIPINPLLN